MQHILSLDQIASSRKKGSGECPQRNIPPNPESIIGRMTPKTAFAPEKQESDQTLISTSTPLGNSSFISASIVFEVEL